MEGPNQARSCFVLFAWKALAKGGGGFDPATYSWLHVLEESVQEGNALFHLVPRRTDEGRHRLRPTCCCCIAGLSWCLFARPEGVRLVRRRLLVLLRAEENIERYGLSGSDRVLGREMTMLARMAAIAALWWRWYRCRSLGQSRGRASQVAQSG